MTTQVQFGHSWIMSFFWHTCLWPIASGLLVDLLYLLDAARQRSFLKVADVIRAQLLCGFVVLTRHVSDIVHHSLDLETTQCNASLSVIEPPPRISFSWVFHPVSWYSQYSLFCCWQISDYLLDLVWGEMNEDIILSDQIEENTQTMSMGQ